MNNGENLFTPEYKVKRFLDALGYFLLIGNAGDVVTDYKSAMNNKREIPMSSCPTDVENLFYGLSSPPGLKQSRTENEVFESISETKAAPRTSKHRETRFDRWMAKEKENRFRRLTRCVVGTDNRFSYDGREFWIDVTEVHEYAPSEHGAYGMDYIICGEDASGELHFFDQNFFEIFREFIQEISKNVPLICET